MEITKDTRIGDILKEDINIATVLTAAGMHCIGCPASIGETLAEACMVHGLDADDVLEQINKFRAETAAYNESSSKE